MPTDIEPQALTAATAEPVPVQLTRMEGNLKLILFQVTDVSRRTGHLEDKVSNLELETQRLRLDAESSQRTVVATATALREAKEAAEATARAEAAKSDQSWSPALRLSVVAGSIASMGGLIVLFR